MADQIHDKRPHLVLTNTSKAQPFIAPSPGGGDDSVVPQLDRAKHGLMLQAQLHTLFPIAKRAVEVQTEQGLESGLGLQIQFIGLPDVTLAFESLGLERGRDPTKQIEVMSVRTDGNSTVANVFVPMESWSTSKSTLPSIWKQRRTRMMASSTTARCSTRSRRYVALN